MSYLHNGTFIGFDKSGHSRCLILEYTQCLTEKSQRGLSMRTSRILEMIYLLLNDRQQTAEALANYFGVSIKTIYRDVDTLAEAGLPITKQQGVNGGIVLDEKYALNKSKLTVSEESALMFALDEIKKLPNAQLEYALKLMKQYFNEAATLWVNTDDVSLDLQEKFHVVKRATIEKNVIEFQYFNEGEFLKYRAEPYELRIKDDIWRLIIRNVREKSFEVVYLSRMMDIEIKSKRFSRIELPNEFGKRYGGMTQELCFEVTDFTDRLLNRFPVEAFKTSDGHTYLEIVVQSEEAVTEILKRYDELEKIGKDIIIQ